MKNGTSPPFRQKTCLRIQKIKVKVNTFQRLHDVFLYHTFCGFSKLRDKTMTLIAKGRKKTSVSNIESDLVLKCMAEVGEEWIWLV